VARGMVESISASTVRRWLASDALKSLSRFPCKPRVTNTVNLSQWEPSGEEDDQRV
jgi:hypothetical protein